MAPKMSSRPAQIDTRVPKGRSNQRQRRRVPKQLPNTSCLVCHPITSRTCNFAATPPRSLSNLYSMPGSTGSVTVSKELGLTVTDFFDYGIAGDLSGGNIPQDVSNYFWDVNQNLFDNSTAPADRRLTFCRVRKFEVYVMPLKGFNIGGAANDPNDTNAQGMMTVNCQVPGVSQVGGLATATNVQVTNILPQIDTFWKRVMKCNLQKTFQSANIEPFFDQTVSLTSQCLFQMRIVDSTTGETYLPPVGIGEETLPIRVKVVLHVDQPMQAEQTARFRVFRNEDFAKPSTAQNGAPFTEPTFEYCQINLAGVRDNFR